MPGDDWQKFANLRLLFGWMYAQPGKKLIFMGGEFGQGREWNHDSSLDWHLLEYPQHRGVQLWMQDLNRLRNGDPALYELDFDPEGFRWIDANDSDNSIASVLRRARDPKDVVLCAFNFTPVPRYNYRLGVPFGGRWSEVLNSDSPDYGGSGQGNLGGVDAAPIPWHGLYHSLTLTLPPLGCLFMKPEGAR
jgi:1,4-alpha-glucan branching enzyme